MTKSVVPFVGISLLLIAGCSESSKRQASFSPAFETVFHLASRIVLQESEEDPIVGIERIAVSSGGRMAFSDFRAARVRVFSPDGSLLAALGRSGEGPGEYRIPFAVEFGGQGSLFVSDASLGRITRYTPELELDTIFPSPGLFTHRLQRTQQGLLAGVREDQIMRVALISEAGQVLRTFPVPDTAAYSVPYWGSILAEEVAVLRDQVVVATNLLYPLWRFGPESSTPDSLGHPPSSFTAPIPPGPGRFAQSEVPDWLRSLSVIAGVFTYRDSALLVVHGRFDPTPTQLWNIEHTVMDIYDPAGVKIFEDIPLPGRVLAGGEYIVMLEASPPERWTIGRYELR